MDRTATELTQFLMTRVGNAISEAAWAGYHHQFAGNAARAERTAADVDFDTDTMRLAAGGTLRKSQTEGN